MIQCGAVDGVPTRSLICSPLPIKSDTASDDRPTSNNKVNSSTDVVLSATAVEVSAQNNVRMMVSPTCPHLHLSVIQ
jgi:galactose mutarotase-like enzyme